MYRPLIAVKMSIYLGYELFGNLMNLHVGSTMQVSQPARCTELRVAEVAASTKS